jgi:acid stress-induced BolA-like protein IbaG/YrbA
MDPKQIEAIIKDGLPDSHVQVIGDGRHFQALIVSAEFEGKPLIQRHRMINTLLKEQLDSEVLHAISMRTLTPEQHATEPR